jgi:peptidoglycan/LPS O-acetylase OafA/YrhL
MYYRGFDGLRAISVLFVLMAHLGAQQFIPAQYMDRLWPLVSGYTGVRIFFVISGFLITTLLLAEKTKLGKINYRNFIIRRALRIAPCFVLFLTVVFLLAQMGLLKATNAAILWSAFFAYNFVSLSHYTNELAHTWSLAVEEHFYLFWPLLIGALTTRRVLIAVGILTITCGMLRQILVAQPLLTQQWFPDRWTIPAVGPILIGCGIAIVNQSWSGAETAACARSLTTLWLAAILYGASLWLPGETDGYQFLIQAMGIGLLLIWLIHSPDSKIAQCLEMGALRYIGRISYGIYIWQGLFLTNGPTGLLWVQRFPQNLFLTFAVASLSYFAIERRFLRLKKNFSSSRETGSVLLRA